MKRLARQQQALSLAEASLRLSPDPLSRAERKAVIHHIADLADRVRRELSRPHSAHSVVQALNKVLFQEESLRGTLQPGSARSLNLKAVLEEKRGSCVNLVILYLDLAERLELDWSAAATPDHIFVRAEEDGRAFNIETLEMGRIVDDLTYRKRHRMDDSSIERGIFMSPLPKTAVLAHFLSNRGVMALRESNAREAVEILDLALYLDSDLPAAHYNKGLACLSLEEPLLAKSSFTRAIELHPLDAEAFNNRGIANQMLDDPDAAREDFEQALRIQPQLKEAKRNLQLLDEAQGSTVPQP